MASPPEDIPSGAPDVGAPHAGAGQQGGVADQQAAAGTATE